MQHYFYQLSRRAIPIEVWTSPLHFFFHPELLPVELSVSPTDRENAIRGLGAWMQNYQLGQLTGESFLLNPEARDNYFAGRFRPFRQAIAALETVTEDQFIRRHELVNNLVSDLQQSFSNCFSDYILLDSDRPITMDEFMRIALPETPYYIGTVLEYYD